MGKIHVKVYGLGLVCLTSLMACGPQPKLTGVRGSALQMQPKLEKMGLSLKALKANAGTEIVDASTGIKVKRGTMSVNGAEVEGTWYSVIENRSGADVYVAGEFEGKMASGLGERVSSLRSRQGEILANLYRLKLDLKRAKFIDTKILLRREALHYSPVLRVSYMPESETDVLAMDIDENGRIHQMQSVAQHLVDGMATVFLGNPQESNLSIQVLRQLMGDGTLSSPTLKVLTALNETAYSPDNVFRFTPDVKPFDEVQAYYVADRVIEWFNTHSQLRLPKKLEIKVHVPGDAMFYFNGVIRLGDGDGNVWRGIARDPSIVAHETSHAFVELMSGLGFEGEPGGYSEGFSDFYAGSYRNDPRLGAYAYMKAPFKRTLENTKKAWIDFKRDPHTNGQVIGATFWDLRKQLGESTSLRLAKSFLLRIGAGGKFADFNPVMTEVIGQELSEPQREIALNVLKQRNWMAQGN